MFLARKADSVRVTMRYGRVNCAVNCILTYTYTSAREDASAVTFLFIYYLFSLFACERETTSHGENRAVIVSREFGLDRLSVSHLPACVAPLHLRREHTDVN